MIDEDLDLSAHYVAHESVMTSRQPANKSGTLQFPESLDGENDVDVSVRTEGSNLPSRPTNQIRRLPSLRLFITTVTLDRAIAPAAMAGWRSLMRLGTHETVCNTPAANGTREAL